MSNHPFTLILQLGLYWIVALAGLFFAYRAAVSGHYALAAWCLVPYTFALYFRYKMECLDWKDFVVFLAPTVMLVYYIVNHR